MKSSRRKYEKGIASLTTSDLKVFFAHVRRNRNLSRHRPEDRSGCCCQRALGLLMVQLNGEIVLAPLNKLPRLKCVVCFFLDFILSARVLS